MADVKTTETTRKLHVVMSVTDKKSVTFTIANPGVTLTYQSVADWADDAVTNNAFVVDGLPVTGLKEAYIETTTKVYLEEE